MNRSLAPFAYRIDSLAQLWHGTHTHTQWCTHSLDQAEWAFSATAATSPFGLLVICIRCCRCNSMQMWTCLLQCNDARHFSIRSPVPNDRTHTQFTWPCRYMFLLFEISMSFPHQPAIVIILELAKSVCMYQSKHRFSA